MLLAMAKESELLARKQLSDNCNGNQGLIREVQDDISTEPPASCICASGGSMLMASGNVIIPSQQSHDGVVGTVEEDGSLLGGGLQINGIPLQGDFAFAGGSIL